MDFLLAPVKVLEKITNKIVGTWEVKLFKSLLNLEALAAFFLNFCVLWKSIS